MMATVIKYAIETCMACPFSEEKHTPGSGYASDYFCKKMKDRRIACHVEWPKDMGPVPKWCPIREAQGALFP